MADELRTEKTEVVEREEVAPRQPHNRAVFKAAEIVWFIVGLVTTILLVRFVLALLGANLQNAFASFMYSLSEPFVAPFRGLLQISQFQAGVSRFEIETLLAAFIYLLIGWGVVKAIELARR